MALITRVSRLFRADFHAVLDRIEEPEVMLRQAVREMEEDIARDEQRTQALAQQQERLAKRSSDLDESLQRIEEELDVCFASNKEDLARSLIKRRLEAERLRKVLGDKLIAARDTLSELDHRLQQNRGRLTAMQQKVELLTEEDVTGGGDPWTVPDIAVRDEDVEVAFLREKRRRQS